MITMQQVCDHAALVLGEERQVSLEYAAQAPFVQAPAPAYMERWL